MRLHRHKRLEHGTSVRGERSGAARGRAAAAHVGREAPEQQRDVPREDERVAVRAVEHALAAVGLGRGGTRPAAPPAAPPAPATRARRCPRSAVRARQHARERGARVVARSSPAVARLRPRRARAVAVAGGKRLPHARGRRRRRAARDTSRARRRAVVALISTR